MRKLMMLMAMLALVAAAAAAPAALAQDASVNPDVNSKIDPNGVATAKAGGTAAVAGCPDVPPEAKAGDVVAKAPCKPPPPPPPKAAPPPPPPAAPAPAKALPPTGGAGTASLLGLGAGALLVGGGLLIRRIVG